MRPCFLDLEFSDECGQKLYEAIIRGECPEMFCISKAVEYARKNGDYYKFLTEVVKMAPISFVPSIDVVSDCTTAAAFPIAVDAVVAIEYGILDVPIVNGYALMDLDSYGELVHRWLSSLVKRSRSIEKPAGNTDRVRISINIPDSYPPCIKSIIKALDSGEEVSHFARFALVTFLNKTMQHVGIDMRVKLISQYFVNANDYDPKKTEYQVRHILGLIGKRAEYSVPTCKTMREHGLCVAKCGVRTPYHYYIRQVAHRPKVI